MEILNIFGCYLLLTYALTSLSYSMVDGEIRLRDMLLDKDKKSLVTKNLKKTSADNLKEFIKGVDKSGKLRRIIKRKLHIPKDSSLSLSTQVSRPNIFPNIFNQEDGFIVDAVIEWPLWLDLHAFAEAMHNETMVESLLPNGPGWNGEFKNDLEDEDTEGYNTETAESSNAAEEGKQEEEDEDDGFFTGPQVLGGDEDEEQFTGKSSPMSGIIGLERCHIYDKIETGMSVYLDISRNQSHDCVLRAICESQLIADFYPDAPSSIFFEVIHLILKPSLGMQDSCFENYLVAEKAAYQGPEHCSKFLSKCPLNIAGLFVRNFFPEIL